MATLHSMVYMKRAAHNKRRGARTIAAAFAIAVGLSCAQASAAPVPDRDGSHVRSTDPAVRR
jgi:hypothetical protein